MKAGDYTIRLEQQAWRIGQVEGKELGVFKTWREAVLALAEAMSAEGFYPDVWEVNDRQVRIVDPNELADVMRAEYLRSVGWAWGEVLPTKRDAL